MFERENTKRLEFVISPAVAMQGIICWLSLLKSGGVFNLLAVHNGVFTPSNKPCWKAMTTNHFKPHRLKNALATVLIDVAYLIAREHIICLKAGQFLTMLHKHKLQISLGLIYQRRHRLVLELLSQWANSILHNWRSTALRIYKWEPGTRTFAIIHRTSRLLQRERKE